tara:strand:+ start:235 stop:888 length:654 start_codon:yes stop_codon:yes gene_type:complete
MKRVLVSTASFGKPLASTWVDQESTRYKIDFNRVDETNDTARPAAMHPRLCAKMPKILAWERNPGYDYYVWVDGYYSIPDPTAIERMVDYCLDTDACFFKHTARTSVAQEAEYLIQTRHRCEGEKIQEQLDSYSQDKDWEDNFLIEAGVFIYSKNLVSNRDYNIMKEWFHHVCIWNIRDQVSLPYLLYKFNTNFKLFVDQGTMYNNNYTVHDGTSHQ